MAQEAGGAGTPRSSVQRLLFRSLVALAAVVAFGTLGYWLLGFTLIDALYQTTITVTTVGFREVEDFGTSEKIFTMIFLFVGVGVVLYTLTALLGLIIEGYLDNAWGRRRMDRAITRMSGHAIVCGWGRVGKAASEQLIRAGQPVVVVDEDEERLESCPYPSLLGDAAEDEVLRRAGIERARTLVATLDDDAASLYVTLTARAINPELVIIARSRTTDAERKLHRAGADRVVNPQQIGGTRIAAFALQPHVVDFLEVAMHDHEVEFKLEEVAVQGGSPLAGATVRESRMREGDGAMMLALRKHDGGGFVTNPPNDVTIEPADVVIAIGTDEQLADLRRQATAPRGLRLGRPHPPEPLAPAPLQPPAGQQEARQAASPAAQQQRATSPFEG
jgi:voltage-gated potassium channel